MTTKPLTVEHGRVLATDLIRTLAPLSGDKDAINAEMGRWVDVLGSDAPLVALAVVQMTFAECLTLTPASDLPPNRLALVPPNTPKDAA